MTQRRKSDGRELGDDELADVEVLTGLRATSLRFEVVPEVEVWFEAEPGERSSSKTERDNLPEEVDSGVTYEDIGVRWQARSRIDHPTDHGHTEAGSSGEEVSDE
jgi:hypothetical protein